MPESRLDVAALYVALDSKRQQLGLSWRQVASQAGVGASTLSRMAQKNNPDVDSFIALVQWLRISAEEFMRGESQSDNGTGQANEPAQMVASLLRADRNLDADSASAIDDILRAAMRLAKKSSTD